MVTFSSMEKRYYIKELIKALGISRKTYYNWEEAGKVKPAKRDKMSGFRYWTEADVKKLVRLTGRG